jgi:hypothetical protein
MPDYEKAEKFKGIEDLGEGFLKNTTPVMEFKVGDKVKLADGS